MAESNSSEAELSPMKSSRYSLLTPSIEKSRSPGPALYGPSNYSLVTPSSPQYSIALRFKSRPPTSSITPAANCYDRSNYKPGKRAPSYSFGLR